MELINFEEQTAIIGEEKPKGENRRRTKCVIITYSVTTLVFLFLFIACFVMIKQVEEDSQKEISAELHTFIQNFSSNWYEFKYSDSSLRDKFLTELQAVSTSFEKRKIALLTQLSTLNRTQISLKASLQNLVQNFSSVLEKSKSTNSFLREKVFGKFFNLSSAQLSGLNVTLTYLRILVRSSGWYMASNNRMYKVFTTVKSYRGAENACRNVGANLAAAGMRDPSIRRELSAALSDGRYWIGLDDKNQEGRWMWSDGVAFTEASYWAPGEPNNAKGAEDCAEALGINRKLNDRLCSVTLQFLCEI